jgi:hypothetical protein
VRSFDTTLKFDRTAYSSTLQQWMPNTSYTAGQIVTYAYQNGNAMVRQAYKVKSNITTSGTFFAGDYTVVTANTFTNASDRIVGYYEPTAFMPVVDVISVPITLANTATDTNTIYVFNSDYFLNGMYISSGNVTAAYITNIVSNVQLMIDSRGTIIGNVHANSTVVTGVIGDVSKLYAAETYANVGYFPGDYVNGASIPYDSYVTANTVANTITLNNRAVSSANLVPISYGGIPIKVTQLTLSANITLDINQTITGTYDSLDQLLTGIDYPSFTTTGHAFKSSPLFGRTYDDPAFDSVQFSVDGIPLLSNKTIDVVMQSFYTDLSLGTAPEDITTDGGAYLDKYHSHAPEELVPGQTFDTLDMRIYTNISTVGGGQESIAYRIFNNMLGKTSYLRIGDLTTTQLVQPLSMTDANIYVYAASRITSRPDPVLGIPGVIFIGNERITFYTIDLVNNVLGQIRRGTQGTSTPLTYPIGSYVIDAGNAQVIPGTVYGSEYLNANIWYNAGSGTAVDGSGMNGSTTEATNFLRLDPGSANPIIPGEPSAIVTENAINIDTEDGRDIYTED